MWLHPKKTKKSNRVVKMPEFLAEEMHECMRVINPYL